MVMYGVESGLKLVMVVNGRKLGGWREARRKGVIFDGFSGSGSFLLHAVGGYGGSNGTSG